MSNQEFAESFFEMKYLEEEGLFELAWYDSIDGEGEKHKYFSVRLAPSTFEQMSADTVRLVKDYNLMQACKYQEKENANAGRSDPAQLEHSAEENLGSEAAPEESKEDQPRANGETQGVNPEV